MGTAQQWSIVPWKPNSQCPGSPALDSGTSYRTCESWRVCHSCGREVEMAGGQSLGEAMGGWLILSRIKDKENFDRFSFCSMGCLQTWA